MTGVDRSSPIPIYHQLKALIRGRIEHGVWQSGDRIPTERELCQSYGISRAPVRQALQELAREGILIRRPGQGTFVSNDVPLSSSPGTPVQVMSSDPYWPKVLTHIAQSWNVDHPGQKVTFQVDVVDHNQFYGLLSTAVGSGTAPDIAMVDCVWVAGLTQSGFLYALEDLDSQGNHAEFIQDLYPAFVEANSFNGTLYGLPVKADISMLWYRKDWFAQEGLSPPQSWDDLVDVVQCFLQPQVQERYGLTHPLAFPGGTVAGESTTYNLMPFIWSAGGEIFDAEEKRVVLDSPETRRALQFLRELVTLRRASPPEVIHYKWETTPWLFANGKVAMAFGGSYQSDMIRDIGGWKVEEFMERVGCVAPPAAPGESPVSTVGGSSYVILRQCQRPNLMKDVLKTAINPNVTGEMYCSMLQHSACLSFDDFLTPKAEPLLRQVARMIASGHSRPSIPGYFKISRQLQTMFEATISDSVPIDQIVRRTAEFIGVISGRDVGHS
jgi:ABC-type glycerol-3-phosphate transport system substrate-binding protein